jgi:hypothetical protein
MEVGGVFLDVGFYRKEILIDEGRDFIVGIGFGLQPNARASSRGSAEVEQQGLLVSLCLSECRINVFVPLNCHFQNLLEIRSSIDSRLPRYHFRSDIELRRTIYYPAGA